MLIDTNILASLFIEGPFTESARQLFAREPFWRSERFILVEMSNVLATQIKVGRCDLAQALDTRQQAEALITPGLIDTPHATALALAAQFKVSAYDARYLGAAQTLGLRLITEDTRLRRAAPDLTQSLAEALAELA